MKVCVCVCVRVLTVVGLTLNDARVCVGQDLGGVHALEESVEGTERGGGGGLKGKGFSLSFCCGKLSMQQQRVA